MVQKVGILCGRGQKNQKNMQRERQEGSEGGRTRLSSASPQLGPARLPSSQRERAREVPEVSPGSPVSRGSPVSPGSPGSPGGAGEPVWGARPVECT